MRALQRIDRLHGLEYVGPFLRGIARRVTQEHHRSGRRDRHYEDLTALAMIDERDSVVAICDDRAMLTALRETIDALPLVARRMLEMRYHEGMNATEIGAAFDLKPTAVRVSLLRIREQLRKRTEASLRASRRFR